ncbi:DEAD/DEAH box helicase [Propionivibrio sp.]|uniref:DEAD/DEAH box helicase n=1 Tax=Propionivibrio sp. TaxID=2212460 RepID=UPI0026320231|nr:DEAD/DEAH box helicase [Propionivibrio sp.]
MLKLSPPERFKLRAYQTNAEQLIRSSMARGARRTALYLPTGGGKTLTATSIITQANNKGRKVVFLANRKQLINQTSAVLTKYGIRHGILQADNTRDTRELVLVASIDTVHVRGLPDDVGLLIIDECHAVAGSEKYKQLMFKYNMVPVIGLTATPFSAGLGKHYAELDGALFQELVVGATIKDLIAEGYLVDCDIYAPSEPDLKGVKIVAGDYADKQLGEAVDKPELIGDIVSHWFKLARGKQTVVFACNIPHSKHITESFIAKGIAAEHIDYFDDDATRADKLARFARGETMILSNCSLLSEGWDCPSTEVMILARPTRSLIRFIQMVGRVLRPADGKLRALLLDHSGSTARLGHPCDDLLLELDDGKPKKSDVKDSETKEKLPKACSACHFMKPAGVHVCPECGFAPERQNEVLVGAGELVKLERKKPVAKGAKQHVYSQLLFVERQRRYRSGWAANQYRSIFDVWPRGLNEVTATPSQEILNKIRSNQIAYAKRQEADHARG